MLTIEPRFDRKADCSGECVLCGRPRNAREPNPPGGGLREFCADCIEQEFADDALELWSWFCGPAEKRPA